MRKAVFLRAAPYGRDALQLPVRDLEAALPYYETRFGFTVESRREAPLRSAILVRDQVRIGLAENGGEPEQEGCFFEVDDVAAAFTELRGQPAGAAALRLDKFGDATFRVFFEVAPDGLCYMLGQRAP